MCLIQEKYVWVPAGTSALTADTALGLTIAVLGFVPVKESLRAFQATLDSPVTQVILKL